MDDALLAALMLPGELPSLDALLGRPPWHAQAACRGEGPDRWFPERGANTATVAEARAVCRSCAVRVDCLSYAFASPNPAGLPGVWGGLSSRERRHALRRGLAPADAIDLADRRLRLAG
ncbi:MAG: WhiB family transcriptional regulator [Acidimicrobiia bacterium]|nr:WhiB family transcriptional regulator [Acidimicrobiia bacterium]